ncbi:MAG: hypothetical protein QM734_16800 [Cyclobacteriaceae bacterium]
MRGFFCLMLVLLLTQVEAQKFSSSDGEIKFSSRAQLELIEAKSIQMKGIINSATNQFAFLVDIKSFQGFNSNLQRQHFNDKYMESDKLCYSQI